MASTESKPMVIDMKCGCGASLYVEVTPGYAWDFGELIRLATTWTGAHRVHHVEPKAKEQP